MRRIVIVSALTLSVAASALAASPAVKHTKAGNAKAAASILTKKNLGSVWTATKSNASGVHFTCTGFSPSGKGITETGAAGSPAYSTSAPYAGITQTTSVFGSAKQASRLWSRAMKPGLFTCLSNIVGALKSRGITTKVSGEARLAGGKTLGAPYTGFRITLTSVKPVAGRKIIFDVVFVRFGAAISEITFTSFTSPIPAKVQQAITTLVAHNLGARGSAPAPSAPIA